MCVQDRSSPLRGGVSRRAFLKAGLVVSAGIVLPIQLVDAAASALVPPAPLLDPLTQPRFVNPLPNPLLPGFIFRPIRGTDDQYAVGVHQFRQWLGLVDPATGAHLMTTVWGYGNAIQAPTYPGRTFMAHRNQPVTVRWTNDLVDASQHPLPHLLPVDSSLHWADPLDEEHDSGAYTGPVPVVTHLHGGHSRSDSDGLPDAWFIPGAEMTGRLYRSLYTYDNDQEAGTLWYHDHALGITRLNVYAGLAGLYILRDENELALQLPGWPYDRQGAPTTPYEVPIVIQDRMFLADGALWYPSMPMVEDSPDPSVMPEFFGDTILVNGVAWPKLEVEPRKYRFRVLNGSDSRFYAMQLKPSGRPPATMVQIGTDAGFLYRPLPRTGALVLAPGERADIIVDFAPYAGQTLVLTNNAATPFPFGTPTLPPVDKIMAFTVARARSAVPDLPLPDVLRPAPFAIGAPTAPARQLVLFEGSDSYGRIHALLGPAAVGGLPWEHPVTEDPQLGSVEVWEIYNSTPDAHPIHLHLVSFEVIDRAPFRAKQHKQTGALSNIRRGAPTPAPAHERGPKDTVHVLPGQVIRIKARFDRPGEYVWHCHILSHEDHEMMRPYKVVE